MWWWSSKRGSFGSVNDHRTQKEFSLAYKLPLKIEYTESMEEASTSSALSNNLWVEWQWTAWTTLGAVLLLLFHWFEDGDSSNLQE